MLIGPLLAAAVVLIIAGTAKIARPEGTATALRAAGLPGGRSVATTLGLGEVLLGTVAAIWAPSAAVAALAVVYLAFSAFSIRLIRRQGSAASCGCFGMAESPVHTVHVVVNALVAATVGASLVWPADPITAAPIVVVLGALVLAATLIIALTTLPRVLIAAEEVLAPSSSTTH